MKLTDLNPSFYDATGGREGVGLSFDCPCGNCKHLAYLNFRNPVDGGEQINDHHPSWERQGGDFETMSLTPSIQRASGCRWHGYLTNGELKEC